MNLLGIDLGTTGCKSLVINQKGQILTECYAEYELDHTPEGYIEQDAQQWWSLVQDVIRRSVLEIGQREAQRIDGLSISSQGISFVPVDRDFAVLGPAISWLDSRAVEQCTKIRELFAEEEIFQRTGKRISPAYTLPKLLWLKQNQPDIYRAAAYFLLPLDFITHRLTGVLLTDYAMASGTMAFNIQTGKWDEKILSSFAIDPAKLPPVAAAGSPVGRLLFPVAADLGLPGSVMVYLGTQDQKCAALAAGIRPGVATVSLGTASAISTISSSRTFDQEMRVPSFALDFHSWILESVIGTASVTLKWLKNILMPTTSYQEMDLMARQSPPGSNGVVFYPHFAGAGSPFWQDGLKGSFQGLTLSTAPQDLVRALLEGIAYQIRTNLKVQEEINNETLAGLKIFGGGSKSDFWCTLIADITGVTVERLNPEIANLGAALLAAHNLSEQEQRELFSVLQKPVQTYIPQKEQQTNYRVLYGQYREIERKIMS